MTCHDDGGAGSVTSLVTLVPLIAQIIGVPAVSWNTIPLLNPSEKKPPKSPVAIAFQPGPKLIVVVTGALRLFEALPSLTTQFNVRVGSDPPLVGSEFVELKVTESSTCW